MDFSRESPCVFRPQSIPRIVSLKTQLQRVCGVSWCQNMYVLMDKTMSSGPCGSEYDFSHWFLYQWGIEEKQRWEVNLSTYHAQQSIVAKLSCKVPTQYFYLILIYSFSSLLQCELYHWVDLLDRFDGILADAGQTVENMSWMLVCDRPEKEQLKMLLLAVLNFTALLIEYSFSRHLYSSIEVGEV